jgi:plasmid stability protein
MPVLYVENVPDDLYDALREQARAHRKSIAAEMITLLERHVPTPRELGRRRRLLSKALKMSAQKPASRGPFPSSEEMLRADRER